MLELSSGSFIEILNSSTYGILCLNLDLDVTFCNKVAAKMLNSPRKELIGKYNPIGLDKNLVFSRISELKNKVKINIDKWGQDKYKGYVTGLRDVTGELNGLCVYITLKKTNGGNGKRTFLAIRLMILSSLLNKRKTINQIAKEIGVNWRTVEKHLTYLVGKRRVKEVFSSRYVRIFELTNLGRSYFRENKLNDDEMINLKNVQQDMDLESFELSKEVEP